MNLETFKNKDGKVWLNVASSTNVLADFVNLDNHIFLRMLPVYAIMKPLFPKKYWSLMDQYQKAKKKAILVRQDCRRLQPISTESVDHILCSHFLEHLYPTETEQLLQDFYRVLKRNGTVHVIVPDLMLQIEYYLKNTGTPAAADVFIRNSLLSRETRGSLQYRLLEFFGSFGLQHRWMYDHASLSLRLNTVGFKIQPENDTPSRDYRQADGQSVHLIARKS